MEARILDDVNDGLHFARKYIQFHVKEDDRQTALDHGIPFYERLVKDHPHAIHKIEFRIFHLRSLPTYFTTPTTICQMKRSMFQELVEETPMDLTINNAIIEAEDLKRWNGFGVNERSPSTWSPIVTPTAYFSDVLHHMDHDQVYTLFINNPDMQLGYFRAIIPPEAMIQDYSASPQLYEFTIKKGVLTYYPERDLSRPYKQPASCVTWLTTHEIVPRSRDGPTLHVRLIESNGPWHVFSISYAKFSDQPVRTFRGLDLVTLPQVYRRSLGEFRVPRKMLRSMILYGKTVPKHKREDLFAKIRQSGGVLENSAMPIDLLVVLINVVCEIMDQDSEINLESRFHRGFTKSLRYYTYGAIKANTVDRYRRGHIQDYLRLIHDGDGDLDLSTHTRFAKYKEGCLGLENPTNELGKTWAMIFNRLVSWRKEKSSLAQCNKVYTLDEALRRLDQRKIRVCPFTPGELQHAKRRLHYTPTFERAVLRKEGALRAIHAGLLRGEINRRRLRRPRRDYSEMIMKADLSAKSLRPYAERAAMPYRNRVDAVEDALPVVRLQPPARVIMRNDGVNAAPALPVIVEEEELVNEEVQAVLEDSTVEMQERDAVEEETNPSEHGAYPVLTTDALEHAAALLAEHKCETLDCPNHTGDLPTVCSSGVASRYTGPCHLCPQYADGTPIGGASEHAKYITTVPAARRNFSLASQKAYDVTLDPTSQLDVLFPRTAGKRYHPAFAGKLAPMRCMYFPVTEEDCLLVALTKIARIPNVDTCWEILHRFSSGLTRKALLRENSMLTVHHLEILCLYYQLNVGLVIRDPAFSSWPVDYGVREGPRKLLLLADHHFSVLENSSPLARHFKTKKPSLSYSNRAERKLKYLLADIKAAHVKQDKTSDFVPYVASWPRAEALVRAMRSGEEGTLRSQYGEEYVQEMENIAEQRTRRVQRTVQLLVDVGEGGNGKSRPILDALCDKKYHLGHLFQVVLYNNRLQQVTAKKLNLRAPCLDGRGTPKHFCETWENAITGGNQCCLVVFDEISKFHPGYVDLYIALNPMVTHVIILGDSKQNSHHTPGESPLNDTSIHMPEDEYYNAYAKEYTVGTMRTPQRLAKFMNIPTCNKTLGDIRHAKLIPEGAHAIVPSTRMVQDISALQARDADTSASSQGLDWDHVALVITDTVVKLPSVHALWTALGRVKRTLTIVWQCVLDPSNTERMMAFPPLAALLTHRYRQDKAQDSWLEVDWYGLMQHKLGAVYDRLRLPQRDWQNLAEVDFSRYPMVPTGGRKSKFGKMNVFEDLPAMVRAHYEITEPEYKEVEVAEEEKEPLVHATATHVQRINVNEPVEMLKSRVREKYERELFAADTYSQQHPDRPMASRADPKQQRSDFEFREDGTVDPTLIALHHVMKSDDKASTTAGIKKRITKASRADNLKNYEQASEVAGPALWSSLCDLLHWDKDEVFLPPSEEELAYYQREHEDNRKKVKTLAMLANKEKDAEPEKHTFQMDLGFKQEMKIKEESEGSNAKASQTLVTVHDNMLMQCGKFARFLADKILASCPTNVYIHLKKSPGQLHRYIRRHWKKCSKYLVNDYEAFDQKQDGCALYLELKLFERFSLPKWFTTMYFESKVGAFSWLGHLAIMRFTGEFGTYLFNTLFNMAYANLKFDLSVMISLFGGDDSAFCGVPLERDTWPLYEKLIELVSKEQITEQPSFVSWYLTELGIFKSPKILYTRYMIHKALGDLHLVTLSYFYEFCFAARMFDDIHQFLDDEQSTYHSALVSIFYRRKSLFRSKVYLDTDKFLEENEAVFDELMSKLGGPQRDMATDIVKARFEQLDKVQKREFIEEVTRVSEADGFDDLLEDY